MLHSVGKCLAITTAECHQYTVSAERDDLAGDAHDGSLGEEWHCPLWVEKVQITQVLQDTGSACTKHSEHTVRVDHVGAGCVVRRSFDLVLTQLPDCGLGSVHTGNKESALD